MSEDFTNMVVDLDSALPAGPVADAPTDDAGDDSGSLADDLRKAMDEQQAEPREFRTKVRVKATDKPEPADPEPVEVEGADDLHADLEEALAAAKPPEQPNPAWLDEALAPYGEDLAKHGITAKDAVSRLVEAETALRSDPAGTLTQLTQLYAGRLNDGQRLEFANKFLASLGYEAPGALSATERQRLAQYEQQHSGFETALTTARQSAARTVAAFVGEIGQPAYDQLRPLMASFVQSGAAGDLRAAYRLALQHRPDLDPATRAADLRRAQVAKAQRAKTPRSTSVAGEAPSDRPLRDDLTAAYRESVTRARI